MNEIDIINALNRTTALVSDIAEDIYSFDKDVMDKYGFLNKINEITPDVSSYTEEITNKFNLLYNAIDVKFSEIAPLPEPHLVDRKLVAMILTSRNRIAVLRNNVVKCSYCYDGMVIDGTGVFVLLCDFVKHSTDRPLLMSAYKTITTFDAPHLKLFDLMFRHTGRIFKHYPLDID